MPQKKFAWTFKRPWAGSIAASGWTEVDKKSLRSALERCGVDDPEGDYRAALGLSNSNSNSNDNDNDNTNKSGGKGGKKGKKKKKK